jgi:anaerobic glycerol-3-phosphate dehydrogenase
MFTVCDTRMHAGGAIPTPQNHPTKSPPVFAGTPDRCAISQGPRVLVVHSAAHAYPVSSGTRSSVMILDLMPNSNNKSKIIKPLASSSALPDAHPDRRIRQTTSLAGH